jgi:hypothetical protein
MNGLGSAKDQSQLRLDPRCIKAGDHRGDYYLAALSATLDQQELAQATQQAQSFNANTFQQSIRFEPGTLVTLKERGAAP